MTIDTLPFERRPRNTMANNLDKINELIDYINHSTITPAWNLDASATGESVTVGNSSSLKGLMVNGRSVQDGTPTPDAPVPVQVVEGPLSLVIGDASVAIDLQGNTLASLPDGTRDELHIDSAGHCVLTKRVGKYTITGLESYGSDGQYGSYYRIIINPPLSGSAEAVPRANSSGYCTHAPYVPNASEQSVHVYANSGTIGLFALGTTATEVQTAYTGAVVYYKLLSEQTIDLRYITPPAIPSGSVVTISASLTPEFTLEWWVESGITDVIDDLKAYVDYRIGE